MTYLISDIHGEYELFMRLLEKVGFSDSDKLIICGDLIDKGTESVKLLKTVFGMQNAYCIMGNHEYEFFKFYRSRMHSALMDYDAILWHLQQYFPGDGDLLDWETVDRLTELPFYIEEEDFICVHAGIPLVQGGGLMPISEAAPEELVYDRTFKEPSVLPKGEKCVVYGHTPTTYIQDRPRILAYLRPECERKTKRITDHCKIHLDTGVSINGVLGCFRVEDCRAFYVEK